MVNFDLTPVLVSLITAVAGYLSGYRRGRKVFRSGDYTSVPRAMKPGDSMLWTTRKKLSEEIAKKMDPPGL